VPLSIFLQHLEKCIDDALRKNDFKPLKTLLQIDICEDVKIKCSKQFFHKLDDLMCRELNKKDIQTVSTILVSFGRCGKNISILGQAGLLTMIKQGLVQKISIEREIILSQGSSKDEAVINMIEDFFDLLMVIHDIDDEGKRQVVESFIPRICALVIDSRVNICVQQETLKKMNAMLDKMPQDARKILFNQEMLILMSSMGERILDAGDYDLQVGIVEALCRMTTEKQRQELACQWFSMDFVANAFKGIKDSEFETDCRMFLNLVNGILGDKRRVFTFPCLSAFLDKYELQIPSDEKLEDFWIDFNLGSQTLSFYIAGDNDDHQWEAVTVPEEKVQIYSIEVRDSKKLLTIILKDTVKISKRKGKELLLYFDASLEITNVTQKIFGANKYREFSRKQGISVAKTSVHILFDASGSQILVPESQISPVEELSTLKEKRIYVYCGFSSWFKIITPSKRKMSEASMIVPGAERYTVRSPILLINTSTPQRGRIKPPLQMTSSMEKPGFSKTSENGVDNAVSLKSRPCEERNREDNTDKQMNLFSRLPGILDNICGNKMHSKWACWTPVTNIKLCNNLRASSSSEDTFNQDIIINKNLTKKKSSSSISDDNSEEMSKVQYGKELMQHNKIDKAEAEACKRNKQQQLDHSKHSEEKNTENTKQNDWCIESETTFKSVLLNKTVEESVIYRKKYTLSKDVNTAICDKSPSPRKNTKSHRKSGKRLTSELNSWDLKQKEMREKSKGKGFNDAAESLISQINKRYKPKDGTKSTRKLKESLIDSGFSNKSDLQLRKVQKKSYRQLKTTFVNVTSECPLNDVYNFNLSGADEPVIKLGIQEFQATAREACTVTNHKKKTLFSDTDTEYKCDDSKTDISWLRESKSKPQLIGYSRNKNVKKHKSGKSRIFLLKTPDKNITKKVDETVPDGRIRLPRRAAKTKKNYKDLSNSESESEQEFSHSFKEKLLIKENIHSRSKTMKPPKKQNSFSSEMQKDVSKEWKNSSLLKDTIRDNSLDKSPVSLSGSPSSIEVMRCTEKTTERDFTQDFDCVTKSLSPYPKTSSPESLNSGVESPINSPNNSEKNLLCGGESCSPIPQSGFLVRKKTMYVYFLHFSVPVLILHDVFIFKLTMTLGTVRKRMYIEKDLSNSDEVELGEREEERASLLPKKLSKSEGTDFQTYKDYYFVKIFFKLKMSIFQIRHKIMDYFTKHSWKTAQQHIKTMNHQIQEIKKLDKFQFIIIKELENFEKDSQSLKDLEKELVVCAFKSLKMRLHLLKASLNKNVFYNTDYEETIFTSEMCSMKENMKMIQDRLLKEMVSQLSSLDFSNGIISHAFTYLNGNFFHRLFFFLCFRIQRRQF
uniref:Synaptonemal complex protein 2 n=1 Tax=Sus scrofa TaxID=9823 RepID=A0A8D0MC12_PIG